MENKKRDFEEYKTREDELRVAWLQEEEETKGSGRWTEGHSLGLALRPAEPANIEAAYRRVGANPNKPSVMTTLEEDMLATPRHAPSFMPQPEPTDPLLVAGGVNLNPFAAKSTTDVPASCEPPYVSYPGPPAASPAVSLTSSYEPVPKYQAPDSLSAAVA
jgi:hypothetical protein